MKIGSKIMLAITLLLLIALGFTGLLSYSSASAALYNNISESLENR